MQLRYSLSPVATAAELKNRVFENWIADVWDDLWEVICFMQVALKSNNRIKLYSYQLESLILAQNERWRYA